MKGVPVRIEIGPRDIEKHQAVLVNRAEEDKTQKKQMINLENIKEELNNLLEKIHQQLFDRAEARLKSKWHQGEKLDEFGPTLECENGFYQTGWCGEKECELELKKYKASIRCLLSKKDHKCCFSCGQSSKTDVLIAKSY